MNEWTMEGVVDLTGEEMVVVAGGEMALAALVVGAFGAGFRFGYYELGPLLFG